MKTEYICCLDRQGSVGDLLRYRREKALNV